MLVWDDFAWLDKPAPVPPDTVTESSADPLLSVGCKGVLDSDMAIPLVVMPLFDKRTTTTDSQGYTLMGAGTCTSTKLVPRKGANAAWLDDMNDILANQRLLQIATERQPPTIEQVAATLTGFTDELVGEIYQSICDDWWAEATKLYHIVRSSIELGGVFEAKDLKTIKATCHFGEQRHGPALLMWTLNFTDGESVAEQAKLITKVEKATLKNSPTLEEFQVHVTNLLLDWTSISANDPTKPAGFYHRLLHSFPTDVQTGKVFHLRNWLADRIADRDPNLRDPEEFIESFISRASTIGLPEAVPNNGMFALTNKGNNCKLCPARICQSELFGGPKSCLSFNPTAKIPSTATKAECERVELHRKYLLLKPDTKSLKNIKAETMEQVVAADAASKSEKGGGGTSPPKARRCTCYRSRSCCSSVHG